MVARVLDLHKQFAIAFAAAGDPAGMAIFSRATAKGAVLYFSPDAAELGKRCGAVACEPPARDGLALEIGHSQCWGALFGAHA